MDHPTLFRIKAIADQGIQSFLDRWPLDVADGLYAPAHYLMAAGGKRLRAVLALSVAEAEGASHESAMPAALAVELFHNFTLMHDDIMDEAPLRRGIPSVHKHWDVNAAILSGDAMYTLATMALAELPANHLRNALRLFSQTALEVCIGQQADMAFEQEDEVSMDDYLEMIRKKTSVLIAASAALGAISAGASQDRVALWYAWGEQLGLAFQMKDDLLDAFGSEATGKQVGGDILADKKTFLRIHTWAHADDETLRMLKDLNGPVSNPQEKIDLVKKVMTNTGTDAWARQEMNDHVERAMAALRGLRLAPEKSDWFEVLTGHMAERES